MLWRRQRVVETPEKVEEASIKVRARAEKAARDGDARTQIGISPNFSLTRTRCHPCS